MQNKLLARVRHEQTKHQLTLVCDKIEEELDKLIEDDFLGLHQTQLAAVKAVLKTAADDLKVNLETVLVGSPEVEKVYEQCRDYDEASIWLERLWSYLKDKFGQRNETDGNGDLAQLLKSADEVIWSCFHSVLQKALGQHGSAPLAYVEPEYSPATIQAEEPLPVNLTLTADLDFLNECLQSLPIPVLRLPPSCVSAPWWLVLVAHEVGHHVQYALDLVGYFREGLIAAAMEEGYSEDDAADSWGRWGEEIFADLFSLMMMGQWALRAISEAETGSSEKMVERKSTYPSPVIRLAFMKRAAEALGLDTKQAILGLDLKAIAETDKLATQDYKVVEAAVSFALKPLPKFGALKDLCNFNKTVFVEGKTITDWSAVLSAPANLDLNPQIMLRLETAREIACGSLRAWAQHANGTESGDPEKDYEVRKERRETIRAHTIEALLQSGPRQTRAGGAEEKIDPATKGKSLANLLRTAGRRLPQAEGKGEQSAV